MNNTIGILGGMGPRATVKFEEMFIESIEGIDQEIPITITVNDGGIPDRTDFLLGKGEDPVPRLNHNISLLESFGADIICIPCNTVCTPKIFNRLETESARLIDLPKEVVAYIKNINLGKVYLLATEGTTESGYYQQLTERAMIQCVVPSPKVQLLVSEIINNIKTGNINKAKLLAVEIKDIVAKGRFDGVILGCTELPIIADNLVPPNSIIINSLEVLAKSCLYYSKLF